MTCGRQLINEVRKLSRLMPGQQPKTVAVSAAGGTRPRSRRDGSADSMSCSLPRNPHAGARP